MNLRKFVNEIIRESKNLKTPKWKETYIAAIIVSITVFVFSLAIMFMDFVISKLIISIFGL